MRLTRVISLVVLLISLGGTIASTYVVGERLADYNEAREKELFAFREIAQTDFSFGGYDVAIRSVAPEEGRGGYGTVEVEFGDNEFTVPVPVEPRPHVSGLPGLVRHEDWLRVLRFAKRGDMTTEQFRETLTSDEPVDRLVLVTRIPRPGADDRTWGRVWKRDWVFDLREFNPDGTITEERFVFPQHSEYRQVDPNERINGLPQLNPSTWQYDAALFVMPDGSGPKIQHSALRAVGPVFAVAVVSVFGVLTGIGLFLMPNRADRALPPKS